MFFAEQTNRFANSPVIRQSGLQFGLTAEIPLGAVAQPALDASVSVHKGLRLGNHIFSLPLGILDPFVRTVTTFNIRVGTTTGIDFPIFKVGENIVVAPRGDLVLMSILARQEQKIKDSISFHAYLDVVGRLGTNVSSLLSQGVNTQIGYGIG
ncbi:MAG: hypothetical protein HYX66_00080 [Ignavibacteria bacterium]|nr:hypothetical protein [Ignavibacteria bacterium]